MDVRTRELLTSTIRCGIFIEGNKRLLPSTLNDIIESHHVYSIAYDEALNDNLLTEVEAEDWIVSNGFWGEKEDMELLDLKNNIELKKLRMYENSDNSVFVEKNRKSLRLLENLHSQKSNIKHSYYSQTCEAFADSAKLNFILQRTFYIGKKLLPKDYDMNSVVGMYNRSIFPENYIRNLARNEPWRSLWVASKKVNFKLFLNKEDEDLTINQKNLILWSTTYDSIQDSYDPPNEKVLSDDDLLDGWFIFQRKKREKEEKKKKLDEKFGSIKSSNVRAGGKNETFVMVNKEEGFDAKSIYEMNDPASMSTIHRRSKALSEKGQLSYTDLPDIQDEAHISAQRAIQARSGGRRG